MRLQLWKSKVREREEKVSPLPTSSAPVASSFKIVTESNISRKTERRHLLDSSVDGTAAKRNQIELLQTKRPAISEEGADVKNTTQHTINNRLNNQN